ncbi:MAG: response regulator [bacterium]|nr:response regulator [bacterium]
MKSHKPILIVEDDVVDAMTVQRSLKELQLSNKTEVAKNGEEALKFLQDPQREMPCIILLDLKMPKMNGIEFLQIVKHDASLKKIPVVVLTTSRDEQDKIQCFELGVAGYLVKPFDFQHFVKMIGVFTQYWSWSEMPDD